jgi:IS30 family transposase
MCLIEYLADLLNDTYTYIYSKEGLANKLWRYLHKHRARRRPRSGRRPQLKRFTPEVCIKMRPDVVGERKQFGHWEADLIQFRKKFGKSNVTSIVERVSRFTVLLRNNDRQSKEVMTGISNALTSLPFHAARSITFDRGTEFSAWPFLQAHLGVEVWHSNSPCSIFSPTANVFRHDGFMGV